MDDPQPQPASTPKPSAAGLTKNQSLPAPVIPEGKVLRQPDLFRTEEVFIGPLPPPSLLAQYEQIFPGAAGAILGMAQTEQQHRIQDENAERQHRHEMDRRESDLILKQVQIADQSFTRGQYMGYSVTILGGAAGVMCLVKGYPLASIIPFLATLCTLAAQFMNRDQTKADKLKGEEKPKE